MVSISSSSLTWMGMFKLDEQEETEGKQLFGHPWLNEIAIFVGIPKVGNVSEPVKNFITFSGLKMLFSKEAMPCYQQWPRFNLRKDISSNL